MIELLTFFLQINSTCLQPLGRPATAGILKTPGKRKVSNNRVEFLNNVKEREIPGRHA